MDELDAEQGKLTRRRWWRVAVVTVMVVAVGAVVVREVRPRFPATDARACAGSTVPIEQQARALGVVLPTHVTQWHYDTSRFDPRTGQSLTDPAQFSLRMEFRARQSRILSWLRANGLPTPVPYYAPGWQRLPQGTGATCGDLDNGFGDWSTSFRCTPDAEGRPYSMAVAVSFTPNGRPEPAVLMSVQQVTNCSQLLR